MIIAGERRIKALELIHKKQTNVSVDCKIMPDDYKLSGIASIVENLQRKDLTVLELVDSVSELHIDQGYSISKIMGLLGKSKAFVTRYIKLQYLPQKIRNELKANPKAYLVPELEEIASKNKKAVQKEKPKKKKKTTKKETKPRKKYESKKKRKFRLTIKLACYAHSKEEAKMEGNKFAGCGLKEGIKQELIDKNTEIISISEPQSASHSSKK